MSKLARILLGIALLTGLMGAASSVGPLAAPAEAATYVSKTYTSPKKGETNSGVEALQRRLVKADVLARRYVTSYFGTKTENAVKRFQRAEGRRATGKVTRSTWRLLVRRTGTITISSGSSPRHIDRRCTTAARALCADKTRDKLYYLKQGRVVRTVDARFGCSDNRTREGSFRVFRKSRDHVSSIYHTAMPFAMFFSGGQAVHYSPDFARNGYNGCSHGCVNVRNRAAIRTMFNQIRIGDRVVVYRS